MPAHDRNRKRNLSGSVPKPGTTWERAPGTLRWTKGNASITESQAQTNNRWSYHLAVNNVYVATYSTFSEAANAATTSH
jgi:hypothetical protein